MKGQYDTTARTSRNDVTHRGMREFDSRNLADFIPFGTFTVANPIDEN